MLGLTTAYGGGWGEGETGPGSGGVRASRGCGERLGTFSMRSNSTVDYTKPADCAERHPVRDSAPRQTLLQLMRTGKPADTSGGTPNKSSTRWLTIMGVA